MRQQDQVPAECLRGIFPCLSQLLVVAVHPWQPLACSYITAISASVVTWPSSLCVSALSFQIFSSLSGIGREMMPLLREPKLSYVEGALGNATVATLWVKSAQHRNAT